MDLSAGVFDLVEGWYHEVGLYLELCLRCVPEQSIPYLGVPTLGQVEVPLLCVCVCVCSATARSDSDWHALR